MFRKTLLAGSLAAFAATSGAATFTAPTDVVAHTDEGLLTAATTSAVTSNYGLVLGAEYAANDVVTFTYSVALDAEYDMSGSSFVCDNNNGAGASDTVNFGFIAQDNAAGTLQYRVTTIDDLDGTTGVSSANMTCVTPEVELDTAALVAASSAVMTFSAATSTNITLETIATGVTVATSASAYSVTSQAVFDQTVDVDQDRKAFATLLPTTSADTIEFTPVVTNGTDGDSMTKAAGVAVAEDDGDVTAVNPTTAAIVTTVSGDWSFLDTDGATDGMQLGANTVTDLGATVTFGADFQTMVITDDDDTAAAETITVTKAVADTVIPNQTYTAETVFTYDTDSTVPATLAAGEWDLNGSNVTVYSMPFGANITPFLWVSNEGASSGTITATINNDGTASGVYELGSVGPRSNQHIASALLSAIDNAGDSVTDGSRVDITITVTAPETDVHVYGGYKVDSDGDRLNLETTQTFDE